MQGKIIKSIAGFYEVDTGDDLRGLTAAIVLAALSLCGIVGVSIISKKRAKKA